MNDIFERSLSPAEIAARRLSLEGLLDERDDALGTIAEKKREIREKSVHQARLDACINAILALERQVSGKQLSPVPPETVTEPPLDSGPPTGQNSPTETEGETSCPPRPTPNSLRKTGLVSSPGATGAGLMNAGRGRENLILEAMVNSKLELTAGAEPSDLTVSRSS